MTAPRATFSGTMEPTECDELLLMAEDGERSLLAAARDVLPLARAEADENERRGRLSQRLLSALHARRLFRLWIPRSIGGEELDLVSSLQVYESIASGDGAAGWAVMIGAGAGLFGGFLEREAAREIFAPESALIAGSGSPSGSAREADGGLRVTGRWSYASGAHHATWFTANCTVLAHRGRSRAQGTAPLIRAVAVPADEVIIHDTWSVVALRGTGSDDFEIVDSYVPHERTFSVSEAPREDGPLYRFPFFSIAELSFASVSLGIARHALDEFRELAQVKRPMGSQNVLREDPDVQARYARAEAVVRASRTLIFDTAEHSWEAVVRGDTLSDRQRAEIALAAVDAAARCAYAVDLLYERAGMTPLFAVSPLGRAWRDVHAVTQNMVIAAGRYPELGSALLNA